MEVTPKADRANKTKFFPKEYKIFIECHLHVLAWGATYLVHGGVVIVVMLCPRVPVRFPSGLQLISTAGSDANHLDTEM